MRIIHRAPQRPDPRGRALQRIKDWAKAFSPDHFPSPDIEAIRRQIGDQAYLRLHAHLTRETLEGVAKIAEEGLAPEPAYQVSPQPKQHAA